MEENQQPEQHAGAVYRVAVRLPPFWPDRPALWFAQAEAQFELAGITNQKTKFNYIISQLDHRFAAEVEDIITSPPEQPFDKLKAELVRRLSSSKEQRVRQLLTHEEMGDRKPSQFLRHLKSLAPDVPDDFLRSIWSSRLPAYIQTIIACQSEATLDAISQLADKIHEVTPPPTVASVAPPVEADSLLKRVEELTRQVAALTVHSRRRSRSRGPQRDEHHSDRQNDAPLCWYHRRFKEKAQRCTTPCSYAKPENQNSSR